MDRILDKIANLKNKYGKGALSVGLAVLLILSTVNIAAFAEGTVEGETEAVETTPEEVVVDNIEAAQPEGETEGAGIVPPTTELGEALISFDVHNGYVVYNSEPILSTTVKTPLTSDFTFEVYPDTGFEVDSVKAVKTSTQEEIGMTSAQANIFTLAAADVSSNVTIKVTTRPSENAASEGDNAATPVEELAGTSSEGQPSPFSQEGTHVVTFISNGEEYTARIVNDGDLVEAPANPNIPEGMSSFIGWYTAANNTGVEFEFSTTAISGDLTLYAHFSDKFLVSFKTSDESSGSIYTTQLVARGEYVSLPTNPTREGSVFQYWYIEGMENPTAFDFSDTPIYSNITLVPQFGDGYYVIFEANGGSDVEHQVVTTGNSASEPEEPTRKGYDFAFWSTDINADSTDEATYGYDFSSEVTDSITLYAIWGAGKVGYTVNIHNEKVNIQGDPGFDKTNYSFVTSFAVSPTDTLAGTAGESLDDSFVAYMTSYIKDRKYSKTDAAIYDLLDYSEYYWTDATDEATGKAKVISGSGDTVINVYTKRISYPIKFNLAYAGNDGGGRLGTGTASASEITLSNGITYSGLEQDTYTCYLKLGEEIGGKWPSKFTILGTNYTNYKFVNFNGWHGLATDGTAASKSYIRVAYLGTSAANGNGRLNGQPQLLTARCKVSTVKEVRYYFTEASAATVEQYGSSALDIGSAVYIATEGTAKQFLDSPMDYQLVKFKNKYYEFNIVSVGNYQGNSWNPKGWPGKEIAGFETTTAGGAKYGTNNQQVAIKSLTTTFNNGMEGDVKIGNICYFMPAKTFDLVLNAGIGGSISNATGFTMSIDSNSSVVTYKKTIKYGEPIDIAGLEVEGGTDFSGWFRGDDFSGKLTDEETSGLTMPASNLVLYAGFADEVRTLTYYDGVGGKQVDVQTVAKGAKTEGSDIYTAGKGYEGLGQFIGWGYMIPGTNVLVEYNFDLAIKNDQTLYALWKTGNFKVTYNIGAGVGETPVDGNFYGLGAKANLLDGSGFTAPAGSSFIGWQPKGSNAIYYPGPATSVTMYGDLNLNAYYVSENTDFMYVAYDANGGEGTLPPLKTIGSSIMVAQGENTFTRDGYKLVGWSTDSGENNAVTHELDAQFTVPNLAKNSTFTLYAVWEEIPSYTIEFVADAGGSLEGTADYTIRANQPFKDVVAWPTPIADAGFYFVNWDPASYNKMYVSENLKFTAHFERVVNPTIVIDSGSKTYGDTDPDPLSNKSIAVSDPDGTHLVTYTPVAGDLTRTAGEDVGTYNITLTDQGIANIQAALTANYGEKYIASARAVTAGVFSINKRTVVITSDYETKEYDGDPLTGDSVTVTGEGFIAGEGASYIYTASITLPGQTPNTFEYVLDANTKASNYDISVATDWLVVTKGALVTDANIVITVGNDAKMYDGQALTSDPNNVVVSGLPAGHTIDVAPSGSLTDSGEVAAGVESYVIKNAAGENVTSVFTDEPGVITVNEGRLTVSKRQVTFTSATDSKLYDGTALTNDKVAISGDGFVDGQGANYNVTGSLVDPGTTANIFSYTFTGGADARNYTIVTEFGTLTVEPVAVTPTVPGGTTPGGEGGQVGGGGNETGEGAEESGTPVSPVVEIVAETLSAPIMMLEDAMGITESLIDENATPFASRTGCWVHWYILLGIMLTVGYAASVIVRRRNFTAALDDFELKALGIDGQAKGGTPGFRPAPQGA